MTSVLSIRSSGGYARVDRTNLALPNPTQTAMTTGSDAVVSGEWPERLRVLLLSAALELAGPHDRDDVLQRIVEGAASVTGARYGALGIYDEHGQLATFVHHGVQHDAVRAIDGLPQGRGLLGEVMGADRPVRLASIDLHPASSGLPPGHPPMGTFLGVPILRAGRRYGNLYVTEKVDGRTFDATDESLIVALAAFAAGAIETTELVESERNRADAETRERSRRELLGHIIAAQEAERARVSRDLHDDLGQGLTSILLGLRLVEDAITGPDLRARQRIADLRELTADGLRLTRQLAFDLRPTVLDDIGLTPALQRLTEDLSARTGLNVELHTADLVGVERFGSAIDTAIYRVVQESLTNIVRHAHASTARVTITLGSSHIVVAVEDDGIGFETGRVPAPSHIGIQGMMERAELVAGSLSVTAAAGRGTVVVLRVPNEGPRADAGLGPSAPPISS